MADHGKSLVNHVVPVRKPPACLYMPFTTTPTTGRSRATKIRIGMPTRRDRISRPGASHLPQFPVRRRDQIVQIGLVRVQCYPATGNGLAVVNDEPAWHAGAGFHQNETGPSVERDVVGATHFQPPGLFHADPHSLTRPTHSKIARRGCDLSGVRPGRLWARARLRIPAGPSRQRSCVPG